MRNITSSSITQEILNAFQRSHGYALAVIGFFAQIFFYYFLPNETVTIKWIVVPFGFLIFIIFTLFEALRHCVHENINTLPIIKRGLPPPPDLSASAIALLLTDRNSLFGYEMLVCVYYKDESEFEQYIGDGIVYSIQTNGMIQILVASNQISLAVADIWGKVRSNDAIILKKLIVKPGIRKDTLPTE